MEEKLTKEILALLNNNNTTVKELTDIKGNYYNCITDTIYITKNNNKKRLDKTNLFCGKLVTICHECIHSVQSKLLHMLNLVFSNLSLIFTIIAIVLMFCYNKPDWYILLGITIVVFSMFLRLALEIHAIANSLKLAEKAIGDLKINNVAQKDINNARKIIKKLMPVEIIKMILDKIIMLAIIVI